MTELLDHTKQKFANDRGYEDFSAIIYSGLTESDLDVIATRYATEVAKRSLERAAFSATIDTFPEKSTATFTINKNSITDVSNISL